MFDFIVIGAMKSGTTTLHDLLAKDKRISLPLNKEAPFFTEPEKIIMGKKKFLNTYFGSTKRKILGKVSPQYMAWHDVAIPNIVKICPDVKIIAVLREPIDRLISHYSMCVGLGNEKRDINAAIRDCLIQGDGVWGSASITNSYVAWSRYGKILDDYFRYLAPENILVLNFNELTTDQPKLMHKIYNHIGVACPDYINFKNVASLKRGEFSMLAKVFLKITPIINKLAGGLPEKYKSIVRFRIIEFKTKVLSPKVTRQEIAPCLVSQLIDVFERDAQLLAKHEIHPYWINVGGRYEHII